ncbi:MAG: hypothetical protein IT330_07680, partial [Anaerolineae bacterium]|nr:hypothetical protein [Anaerolineae bacterium]
MMQLTIHRSSNTVECRAPTYGLFVTPTGFTFSWPGETLSFAWEFAVTSRITVNSQPDHANLWGAGKAIGVPAR